ncbi:MULTISPECIES: NADPH-dependent oxidoreductase [Aneurinibacillus]|uniref:FMN reductase [NAD(P)H] n=1 Tax=Aneurinibacillus thermoaerophilus TaxID=143495 RepID=A0A1G8CZY5_ANETH|nr:MULTISPECIES: NADPH-dependent oxidoreductase [Aneurinibacillus]AMA72277.1 NADPH-dependent oxidoreductase [Aneurinibacillus sp. XH2]MED0674874.1 NADPH-dependent oxidoreductase [Aneurinibacillus thermoaerophilus]MED0679824.1 NADPH-dependent oxidoreductase [Aneurinibacillus thermoaerophilus]MED0735856.1 NADPH-dependent oxidoreductase [Aneurinibacillus thermoaerophilus]MED0758474.1 NADPH-dependent oxidoreductase [Aneurinibacillus thermoaerophilus]
MNEVIKTLTNHRSIRSYTNEPVTDEQLDAIIQAVQAAPSSINGQQVTVICVKDPAKKKKIAELVGNQLWVDQAPVFLLFCADFYRAKIAAELNGEELVITDSIESVIVGASDVGIAMGNAIAAAESMGLGIVPIGGARRNPQELIELLDIPEYVFPVAGLVVGHPADPSALKPRLPREAVYHQEKYNRDLRGLIEQYDEQMSKYMSERTGGQETRNWSQTVSAFYKQIYYPKVRPMLDRQGFKYE